MGYGEVTTVCDRPCFSYQCVQFFRSILCTSVAFWRNITRINTGCVPRVWEGRWTDFLWARLWDIQLLSTTEFGLEFEYIQIYILGSCISFSLTKKKRKQERKRNASKAKPAIALNHAASKLSSTEDHTSEVISSKCHSFPSFPFALPLCRPERSWVIPVLQNICLVEEDLPLHKWIIQRIGFLWD